MIERKVRYDGIGAITRIAGVSRTVLHRVIRARKRRAKTSAGETPGA